MRKILLLLVLLASPVTIAGVSALLSALLWPQISHAQMRQLPVNGKRGVTGAQLPLPQVVIGRNTLQLAPGGLIFDTHNRTIVHASLPVGADVWYQLNSAGQIQRMYILRPNEQTPVPPATK